MSTEIITIPESKYGLTITPTNEEHRKAIQAIVDNIQDDHAANFQAICSIEDSKKGVVARTLSEEEKNEIFDLNIGGQFSKAEEKETHLSQQWQAAFLPFMRG